jgi:5'-phosphate synthase pdxT subunit
MGVRAGVLALQGGVEEHVSVLRGMDVSVVEVRLPAHLDGLDCLFLPGGESTTLMSLLDRWGLAGPIGTMAASGLPVMGTCAGAVLMAAKVSEREHEIRQASLGLVDVEAVRNRFGRQARSFQEDLSVTGLDSPFPGVFIRAPLLHPLSGGVEVLASLAEGPVMVRQGSLWLASFHPELTGDDRIHRLFMRETGVAPQV